MTAAGEYPRQEQELLYALDIGTRSVIGLLARREGDRMHVLDIEVQPHEKRTMLDGQIEDIGQVARVVSQTTDRLEERAGRRLERACVAAAGRALRTQRGSYCLELSAPEVIREERIKQLELEAVAQAERALQEQGEPDQRLFLVGYTVTRFQLDHYPLSSLEGHTGQLLEAEVVATFLPREVVDSLYAVMRQAGLEVASLTLEPIAALNAAIPEDIRLLNLALVDIGAGTSDIAICREGAVVGYTMATVAGDEITEALMRKCLVDYPTAEAIKRRLGREEEIVFTDVVGLEQRCSSQELSALVEGEVQMLADEIAQRVLQVNGGPPSALFLAGGGSKLAGLSQKVAGSLHMDERRVAVAGRYFQNSAFSDTLQLDDPAYTTPLGIAVSAGLGLISDSYRVTLNGRPAKLFRSGKLTVLELLMMNGYTHGDLLGRGGRSLSVQVDGKRMVFYGEPAQPAKLEVNGGEAQPSLVIHAGDSIQFQPAVSGTDRSMTAGELARALGVSGLVWEEELLPPEEPLRSGMQLRAAGRAEESAVPPEEKPPLKEEKPAPAVPKQEEAERQGGGISVELNGQPLRLPPKGDGMPYYLMDLLERSGIDFQHVERPVRLKINGADCTFQQPLKDLDKVEIRYEDEEKI